MFLFYTEKREKNFQYVLFVSSPKGCIDMACHQSFTNKQLTRSLTPTAGVCNRG